MTRKHILYEGLSDDAHAVEMDHEVQMARAQLYHLANDAIRLHRLLKNVSEAQGLEGWVQSKITLAADYIKSVANYIEYEQMAPEEAVMTQQVVPVLTMGEDASAGASAAGAVATVAKPIGRNKMMKRKK